MNLTDLISGNIGEQITSIAQDKLNLNANEVSSLLGSATPLLMGFLQNNAQDSEKALAIDNAISRDHDGSILDNLSAITEKKEEGNAILNHILGGEKSNIENQLSLASGISNDKVNSFLSMLAPVLMGFLGKNKQVSENSGISDILGNLLQNNNLGNIQDLLSGFLSNKQNGGNIGDILGSFLGGNDSKSGGLGDILGGFLKK